MNLVRTTLILGFTLFILNLCAQRIEEWTSFLPYQSGITVTQSAEKIYYGTEWSILKIDKDDFSSERISKVEGLSDIGISKIEYDQSYGQLVIAYTNSNIDVLRSNDVINLPNIKLNNDLTGDRSINDIYLSEGSIFLSTGFGLVIIDADELIFRSTTFTDLIVKEATVYNDQIFIATEEGLYYAKNDGVFNLIDFSLWEFLGGEVGLPALYESSSVAVYKERLYFTVNGDLFSWDGSELLEVWTLPADNISIDFLSSDGEFLMAGVIGDDGRGDVFFYDGLDFIKSGDGCNDRVRDVIQDQNGRVWYADEFRGFRTSETIQGSCQRLNFDSPFSHEVSDVSVKGDKVYVASGGVRDNYDYSFSRSGLYILNSDGWQNYNQDNSPFILDNDLLNFLTIQPHPNKDEVFVGTYWGGLLKLDEQTGEFILYDDSNSSLEGTIGDSQRERVTGLQFDSEDNLWITSFGSPVPLTIFTKEEEWFSFPLDLNNNLTGIVQDESGYLWIPAFGNNGGCYVYDPGEEVTTQSDDRSRFLTTFNSSMTTNVVNSVAVDLDGAVWLGTAEGPIVFDCGSDPFDSNNCPGDRIKVIQDSIVAFLLADQDILSIAVDGANQKWFGTRNGIFVQSPDGEEEIYRFTEDNSPLFDNRIRSLAYSDDGVMMIGTDKGLQSFKTPTSTGKPIHREEEILVYPNPVRPEYKGPIAIKGLVRDALVQITDISGNLVTEIRAFGGQAVWDGRDLSGVEVKSGVYLIFSSDDSAFDRPDSFVTKVMIIR